MKVFLCDFSSPQLVGAALELQKRGVDILYCTGGKTAWQEMVNNKEKFPNTIFHNVFDAVRAIPPVGFDISEFETPSVSLLTEMLECESLALTMMNRMDFSNMPVSKKKDLYYKYLQYWNGILKKMKPDAVILSEVPHIVYNFVLYYLARRLGIPVIMLEGTNIPGRLVISNDYKKADENLLAEYKKLEDVKCSIEDLASEVREYFAKMTGTGDATPIFMQKLGKKMKKRLGIIPRYEAIVKNLQEGTLLRTAFFYVKGFISHERGVLNIDENDKTYYKNIFFLKKTQKIKNALKNEYLELQKEPDFSKKYIYLPLHFQPERSSSPLAGFYVDQILMAKTLSEAVPEGWEIYVREHPGQWNQFNQRAHLSRYAGYYREFAKLKNVRLIPVGILPYDVLANAQAVAMGTGTTGWEALARKKPVLTFGYPWYMYADGVFCIDGLDSCRAAIQKIKNGFQPDREKFLKYLIALEKVAVLGHQNKTKGHGLTFSVEQMAENFFNAFYKELEKIKK